MFGEFIYEANARDEGVVLELSWDNGAAVGRILSPPWVVEALRSEFDVREKDEFLIVPLALCYGLLVSKKCKATFTICGDRTAWPLEWGQLRYVEAGELTP